MDHFLGQMIAKVEEHRLLVEHECVLLSKLLKPWPPSKNLPKEATASQEARATNANENKKEDLSQAEILALEQVDELLCKAKWTRESKSKKQNNDDITLTSQSSNLCSVEKVLIDAANSERHNDDDSSVNVRNDAVRKKTSHKLKKPAVQSHAAVKLNLSKNEYPSKPASLPVRKPIARPSSVSSSRASSRRSDYVPAHVNAPFKTDVNVRVPNRKFNYVKKNQTSKKLKENHSVLKIQSQSLEATAFKTLPEINTQPDTSELKNCSENASEPLMSVRASDSVKESETLQSHIPEFDKSHSEISETSNGDRPNDMESQEKPGLRVEETHVRISHEGIIKQLKDQSCDLRIPSKFKKLYSSHNTLLKQCHDAKICKKVSNTDPAQAFIKRLQSQMEIPEELWIRDRALICLRAHNVMLQTAQSLQLNTFSEKSSYEVMYKAKKKLEFILLMFEKLQDEAEYFSQVQFRPSASLSMDKNVNDSPVKELELLLLQEKETEVSCESEHRIMEKELECNKRWMHLKFMKFYYQLQLHLLSVAEKEWSYLMSSDPSDLSCLQLVHGLMTTNGEHLPAIVDNTFS